MVPVVAGANGADGQKSVVLPAQAASQTQQNSQASVPQRTSKRERVASALKSGVVYGGSALLSGVNAITPHLAGAVDIMVVEQPDGTLKSSPFYVRFGKYTPLRNRDRLVQLLVNGERANFSMHLGSYGHAYFAVESDETSSECEEQTLLEGMMSPPSGYSSGDEGNVEGPMYANAEVLASVQVEVAKLATESSAAADGAAEGPSAAAAAQPHSPPGRQARGPSRLSQGSGSLASSPVDASRMQRRGSGSVLSSSQPKSVPLPPQALGVGGAAGSLTAAGAEAQQEHVQQPLSTQVGFPENSSGLAPAAAAAAGAAATAGEAAAGADADHVSSSTSSSITEVQEQVVPEAAQAQQQPCTQRQQVPAVSAPMPTPSAAVSLLSSSLRASRPAAAAGNSDGGAAASASFKTDASNDGYESTMWGSASLGHSLLGESWQPSPAGGSVDERHLARLTLGSTAAAAAALTGDLPQLRPINTAINGAGAAAGVDAGAAGSALDRSSYDSGALALGASPQSPLHQGYLADTDAHRKGSPAPAIAGHAGSLPAPPHSLALQGLELSLCGPHLKVGCSYAEARQVFEAHRVRAELFAERGAELLSSPELVVRVGGNILPWSAAAPLVVGMAVYGCRWPQLVPGDAPCWVAPAGSAPSPIINAPGIRDEQAAVDEQGVAAGSKKTGVSGTSWRLWPFGGWRERGGSTGQGLAKSTTGSPPVSSPMAEKLSTSATNSTMQVLDAGMASRQHVSFTSTRSGNVAVTRNAAAGGPPSSRPRRKKHVAKSLIPTAEQLASLGLKEGQNTITYRVGQTTELNAYIYLFRWSTKLVISDIDGTITKSDVLGHLLPAMGLDWSHAGITKLFTDIARNGYQIMYLSSRAISQANITRDYINSLVQGQHRMPVGPVIISPQGLLPSLYREMILRRPHEFKIATLQDIRNLFPAEVNPFYSGFGNRDTDEISYREVGVPLNRTFIINPKGELRKAALAIQSSTFSTLGAINDLVHDIFPPLPPPPPRPVDQQQLAQAGASGSGGSAQLPPSASPRAAAAPAAAAAAADSGPGGDAAGTAGGSSMEVAGGGSSGLPAAAAAAIGHSKGAGSVPVTPQLQAAEAFNDLNFWSNTANLAVDVDALERVMVTTAAISSSTVGSLGNSHTNGTLSSVDSANGGDFLSSYNPFAL